MHEDSYHYNARLFSFFVSGFSALEATAYASYSIGYELKPDSFSMQNEEQLRAINIMRAANKLSHEFPQYQLGRLLAKLAGSGEYNSWGQVRNYLIHRAVPSRLISLQLGGDDHWREDSWPDLGQALDTKSLSHRLDWLESTLDELLVGVIEICKAEIASPHEKRVRNSSASD